MSLISPAQSMAAGVEVVSARKPAPPAQGEVLSREILNLKRGLNAVIFAHNQIAALR